MNFRILYLVFVLVFGYLLFFSWSQENKERAATIAAVEVDQFERGGAWGDLVSISNGVVKLTIDVVSGSIVESRLLDYRKNKDVPNSSVRVFGYGDGFKFYHRSGLSSESVVYDLAESSKERVLLLSPGGFKKVIGFSDRSPHIVVVEDSFEGLGGVPSPLVYSSLFRTNGQPIDGGETFFDRNSFYGYAFNTSEDPYVGYRFGSIDEPIRYDEFGKWMGFTEKYFLTAILPSEDKTTLFAEPVNSAGLYRAGVLKESSNSNVSEIYIGPKIRSDLIKIAPDLELTIDMGWFWFLAQPLVVLLVFIQGFVHNWGWSIIVLTILIKLLFWPLSSKGFRSMAKMRALSPKLQELQSRHKNDRQKLAQEMMSFYQKEKINPAGGCLPMLAQFPVFIALFFALRETVELRHEPFVLWLSDLSAPDPFFVLPVVMAGMMYLTQKLNPQPPNMDPIQAQVMKAMPIMISVLFIWLPSGLVLYSVANAGISLVQQTYLYKQLGASLSE